jgi:hypothetical protein
LILRKAKVINYKNLKKARAKRTEKETTKEAKDKNKRDRKYKNATPEIDKATPNKTKRSRKRKSVMLKIETSELNVKIVRISKTPARTSIIQMSGTLIAEDEIIPKS